MNINEFSKSETIKKQLEDLKRKEKFDNLVKETKVKTKIGELEQKSIEVVQLLESFGTRIPMMIESLDLITKDMETEEFKKMLTKLYKSICSLESNQHILYNEINKMESSINKYLEKAEKETEKVLNSYRKKSAIGRFINWYIVGAFIVLSFICGKTILKTQDNINLVNNRMIDIHKILRQDKKYWYDKDSQMLYLREIEKNKQNKKSF